VVRGSASFKSVVFEIPRDFFATKSLRTPANSFFYRKKNRKKVGSAGQMLSKISPPHD